MGRSLATIHARLAVAEDSYGLGPMYGDDGWCRGCGTPLHEQTGPLVMQGSTFPTASVWMPNWRFDTVCVAGDIAEHVARNFKVTLGEVHQPRHGDIGVRQLLPRPSAAPWYATKDLSRAVRDRHGHHSGRMTGGSTCRSCGRWKWLPVSEGGAPVQSRALVSDADVLASPETFGDGLSSFRHLLFRRPLGDYLLSKAKRNWDLLEVPVV